MKLMQASIFLLFIFIGGSVQAQNPKIDQLEMLFSQGHYRKVYRKSNRLLDNPEYDFSVMPAYYKSVSLLELAQNEYWFSKHPDAIKDATKGLMIVRKSSKGTAIFASHKNELSWLKEDLVSWASDLKRRKNEQGFIDVQLLLNSVCSTIKIEDQTTEKVNSIPKPNPKVENNERSKIRVLAEKQLGVPYVWAGASPKGFDCSGFTSYVMQEFGVQLPRRAEDQYSFSKKVKRKEVQKGDLVFFKNGKSISHVGIIISEKGEPLVMIHASSSRGIIETNIETSEYWSQRLYSFGSILK